MRCPACPVAPSLQIEIKLIQLLALLRYVTFKLSTFQWFRTLGLPPPPVKGFRPNT